MPSPHYELAALTALDAALSLKPTVVTYSRLEPLNLSSGDLTPGLEAQIADPLWLVGRQWQFEELRGEDGGSPILVEVTADHAPISRFHPGGVGASADPAAASVDIAGSELPLEVAVEAEAPSLLPERVRAELGMQMLRQLRSAELPPKVTTAVVRACVEEWPFDRPIDPDSDPVGAARRRVVAGRAPDGVAALHEFADRRNPNGTVISLPEPLRTAAGADEHRTAVRQALTRWARLAEQYVAAPLGTSWDPHRLEYTFGVQATLADGDIVLRADEYVGGTLDWYTFDAATEPSLGAPAQPVQPETVSMQVMPAPVRYPGMPSSRFWAFEDARVYLGGLKAGPTDLARLALVEFALAYGNDWFLVPVELAYGDVARLRSIRVVDTFGTPIDIPPSRDVTRPGWTVFQNTPVDDRSSLADLFVLPATLRHVLEGPPLEEVALFRDEMANLVWGVERIVQGPSGEPVQRGLAESRSVRQQLDGEQVDAEIVYRLMTSVPDHWIPFVSVPVENVPIERFATELVRRPMVRFLQDGTTQLVHPHGVLLRTNPDEEVTTDFLRIAEEEVPRDGVVLTRRFELARTPGGGTVLWVGRHKRAGHGEGHSGLKFDIAVPPAGRDPSPNG